MEVNKAIHSPKAGLKFRNRSNRDIEYNSSTIKKNNHSLYSLNLT